MALPGPTPDKGNLLRHFLMALPGPAYELVMIVKTAVLPFTDLYIIPQIRYNDDRHRNLADAPIIIQKGWYSQ